MIKYKNGVAVQLTDLEVAEYEARQVEAMADKAVMLISETRANRDSILTTVVDPMVSNPLRWAELTADKQAEWATYRTALLGVPQQDGFPHTVEWPTQPEVI